MKHASIFLLVFILHSCAAQDKKDNVATVVRVKGVKPPASDPYFYETTDTFPQKPYSITRNILQDKKGNYWFSSWQGVLSYDGNTFVNHTLKNKLIHFHMFSVLEALNGDLWFGSIRGGVYRFNGKAWDLFTTLDGMPDNIVTSIMEDQKGNIWMATDSGVCYYDGKEFQNFSEKQGLYGTSGNWVMQAKDGIIWAGTRSGVSCYNGKEFKVFNNSDSTPFVNTRCIIQDKKGNIWIGCSTGLYCFDGMTVTKHLSNFIGYIFEDKAGALWLSAGAPGGLQGPWKYERNSMLLCYYDGKKKIDIINKPQMFGIIEDKNGIIWYGTTDGIGTYDPKKLER